LHRQASQATASTWAGIRNEDAVPARAPSWSSGAALGALFGRTVGEDTVSRIWRKVKSDSDAWEGRELADESIVRLIL
jgi:hypothetical protein